MKLKIKLIIAAVIVVVIISLSLTLYFSGKKKGKEMASVSGNTGKLPMQTTWGNGLTESESLQIQQFAEALYQDMKGLNWWSRNIGLYAQYLGTPDRIFVGTANYFYDNYGNGENLATWINDEVFSWNSFGMSEEIDAILSRLAKHGIKVQ